MSQDICVVIEHLQGHVQEISYVMAAAARSLCESVGGKCIGILLGRGAQDLANDLDVDSVIYLDEPALAEYNPDAYQLVLAAIISEWHPRLALLGQTSIGTDLAGMLSMRLGLPLISHCQRLVAEGDGIKFISQICGGRILAEGRLPSSTALVNMVPGGYKADAGRSTRSPEIMPFAPPPLVDLHISLKRYIQPPKEDVDISLERILVAVGRGIQRKDNLPLAEELAEALGGAVCASRPVVDQGWLQPTRLVGKSGMKVAPDVYIALGISGAPEHVEGMSDSHLIIAINTDPAAPIFSAARYGVEADILDLLPVLTEQAKKIREVA
ncbi:MAG TPA: electron transfer flavoprotein subunit alpha/FixB family protein [Anaerolineales bacterium]|nr:electron transfer flavoprotein subunit alpha/FixB family protein [Anaerolineales bacterium]